MVQWGRLLVSDVRALGTFESPAGACRCSSVGGTFRDGGETPRGLHWLHHDDPCHCFLTFFAHEEPRSTSGTQYLDLSITMPDPSCSTWRRRLGSTIHRACLAALI